MYEHVDSLCSFGWCMVYEHFSVDGHCMHRSRDVSCLANRTSILGYSFVSLQSAKII